MSRVTPTELLADASGQDRISAKLAFVPAPSPSVRISKTARFGVFDADLEARELRKKDRKIRLQEQPFAVLAFLLERAGNVVSREELRERLWPADTFVDFDHGLNTAVNKLREVLGDSASRPRFIETIARRGYRFVADVEWKSTLPPARAPDRVDPELEIPVPHRAIPRSLFALIQVMYLIFYLEALLHWQGIDSILWLDRGGSIVLSVVLVTAAIGIPVRFYLLSAVGFDYSRLGEKFLKIFIGLLILDQLWAVAPFLLLKQIGFGAALGSTAALLYVPFAERTLVRMAYVRKSE
ncbi:MAG TPA: winged helix-turn-helix domain-containing protein [Terriglobales bacterium]|nr:winged helix-turn-helix domain-containing protein [Terriglobales bacterium]